METIAGNLQILVDEKQAIKQALENQGKEPTDKIVQYAGLIDELENPDKVVYLFTPDGGETTVYAQLVGEEKVDLNATPNDIRRGTKAVTNSGVVDGDKVIPAYHTDQGVKFVTPNSEFKLTFPDNQYDYTKLQAMTAPYNQNTANSVAVDRVVIEDSVYNVGSTEAISNVIKDDANRAISLGITNGSNRYVIRYFTYRMED